MGIALAARRDGNSATTLHPLTLVKPCLGLLIDLSNEEEEARNRNKNHGETLNNLNALNCDAASYGLAIHSCNTTTLDLLTGSHRGTKKFVLSENSSFGVDGPSDFGNEISGAWTPLSVDSSAQDPLNQAPGTPKSYLQGTDTCDSYCSKESWNSNAKTYLSEEEDLIDLSSDVASVRSKSTDGSQNLRTPGNASNTLLFGISLSASPLIPQKRKLDHRLRPSQRNEGFRRAPVTQRTTDRLASPRRPQMESRQNFLLSRPVENLTEAQRKHRRRTNLSDPFGSPQVRLSRSFRQDVPFNERGTHPNDSFRATRVLGNRRDLGFTSNRQISGSNVWTVGGTVSNSEVYPTRRQRSRVFNSPRAHGRVYTSKFLRLSTPGDDKDIHEKRLALALDIDQAERVLPMPIFLPPTPSRNPFAAKPLIRASSKDSVFHLKPVCRTIWRDNEWMREDRTPRTVMNASDKIDFTDDWVLQKRTKARGFRNPCQSYLLEAPLLRDDFYCSVLAYSRKANRLAVALGFKVYLWSEEQGTIEPPSALDVTPLRSAYVTSLAFSSEPGGRAILAVGRADGRIILWSPIDSEPRFLRLRTSNSAAHLSFRPSIVRRPSQRHSSLMAENEVFLVGDDMGTVSVFFVEWPDDSKRFLFGWHGSICIHARLSVHSQQICGISWSLNGDFFATGGNDNLCCLFQTSSILRTANRSTSGPSVEIRRDVHGHAHLTMVTNGTAEIVIRSENVKHQWRLNAAVKAIAFCPWQPGLLAAGGGSNDRCIHFYHTFSGSCLATIDCAAQVTSLLWSTTRREIAATFGFAQPEHPFRVAVYAWPSCEQIVAIPWVSEMRALHAIAYPGRPDYGGRSVVGTVRAPRAAEEGCVVIAGSDGSIKFHEIWSEERKATIPHQGLLGGSDILESLHGIEKEGRETIR